MGTREGVCKTGYCGTGYCCRRGKIGGVCDGKIGGSKYVCIKSTGIKVPSLYFIQKKIFFFFF